MVTDIPKVEPFTFQKCTAFDERVQLADKLNEVIDALNLVGDIPDMQTEIDTLKQSVASLQESIGSTDTNLETVEGNLNKTIADLNALTTRVSALEGTLSGQTADIAENTSEIAGLKTRMDTAENGIEANRNDIDAIEAKQTEHETEIQGLLREVVDGVAMSSTAHGTVQVTINHEDGTQDTSAPIDLGLVQEGGITLSTGATDRSFRLTVQLSDGSSWQTNDFVIPEGGGTEVVVTSVQIKKGSQDDMMKVSIGLSDGSSIDSNDWSFVTPAQFAALQSTVSTNTGNITSLTGRVTAIDSQLDTIDGSLDSLGDRVTALEGSPGYSLPVATASVLGGVKIGTNITVQSDGTISIPNATSSTPGVMTPAQVEQLKTAAVGSTVRFTGDASKVTLHADSVAGSAFTKDIPAAADGGAGTIDQAKYQQIATNQNAITALQGKVSTLETEVGAVDSKVDAIAPTVSVNEESEPPTITIGVNGKTAKANLPAGGSEWEEIMLGNNPRDFVAGDVLFGYFTYETSGSAPDWTVAPIEDPTITADPDARIPFSIMLSDRYGTDRQLLTMTAGLHNIRMTVISHVADVAVWNSSDSGSVLLTIMCYSMNGGGYTDKTLKITKANASTNIYKLYRKKR